MEFYGTVAGRALTCRTECKLDPYSSPVDDQDHPTMGLFSKLNVVGLSGLQFYKRGLDVNIRLSCPQVVIHVSAVTIVEVTVDFLDSKANFWSSSSWSSCLCEISIQKNSKERLIRVHIYSVLVEEVVLLAKSVSSPRETDAILYYFASS